MTRPLLALLLTTAAAFQSAFPVDKKRPRNNRQQPLFPPNPGYRLSYRHNQNAEVVAVLAVAPAPSMVSSAAYIEDRKLKSGQLAEIHPPRLLRRRFRHGQRVLHGRRMSTSTRAAKSSAGGRYWLFRHQRQLVRHNAPRPSESRPEILPGTSPRHRHGSCQVKSITEKIATPAGQFHDCILIKETAPLEKGVKDRKWYAKGVGPVKDSEMLLVSHTPVRLRHKALSHSKQNPTAKRQHLRPSK